MRSNIRGAARILNDPEAHFRDLQEKSNEIERRLNETGQKVVFGNVGLAISSWARMEEMLVVIVAMLLRVPNEKAGLVMYSILNFNSWIEIINVLFELDDQFRPFRRKWSKIGERIRSMKDQRDQLAHHSIEHTSIVIRASILDVRTKTKKQRPLDANEIVEFSNTVTAIALDLVKLAEAMSEILRDVSPRKSAE